MKLTCAVPNCTRAATLHKQTCKKQIQVLKKQDRGELLSPEDRKVLRTLVFCEVHYASCREANTWYKQVCNTLKSYKKLQTIQEKLYRLLHDQKVFRRRQLQPLHHVKSKRAKEWRELVYQQLPSDIQVLEAWIQALESCINSRDRYNNICVRPQYHDVVHERFPEMLHILFEEAQKKLVDLVSSQLADLNLA